MPPAPAARTPPAAPGGVDFDAPIPAGWLEREFAVQKAGFLQSRWSDPSDPRSYVLINWVDGDRAGPAAAAVTLRATVAGRTDYREIRFGPTRGNGWIWVYTIRDAQGKRAARIDLLSRRCGVLFAVLGSTSPKRFVQLQRTFVTISQGIRVKDRRRCR